MTSNRRRFLNEIAIPWPPPAPRPGHAARPFAAADLPEYAPVTSARAGEGQLSVAELCEAALSVSDNTAANLLLDSLGGPARVTAHARSLGETTELARRVTAAA